ncbi:MAG: hypothetical protein R8L07_03575 [Alphaproteobacteria bacterium]|nr:hypothetical protein [Alphaproteobacteria bacterium]
MTHSSPRTTRRTRTAAAQTLRALADDLTGLAGTLPAEAFVLRRLAAMAGDIAGRIRSSGTAPGGGRDAA